MFINGDLFKDAPNGKMPSSIVPALKKVLQALVVLIGVGLNMQYNLVYCREEEFYSKPFFYK